MTSIALFLWWGHTAFANDDCLLADQDADGYSVDIDCNDNDNTVHPGASETCDGLDNNCDGSIDEGVLTSFYVDVDGDGFGHSSIAIEACVAPNQFVADNSDCDDARADTNPSASETCDGLDNNCDGTIDEGINTGNYFPDADGDGFISLDEMTRYLTSVFKASLATIRTSSSP